uniref:Candidate secreted effector n=1 Tax=Meloidogyne incognita TaxID=6306 RepID=A0A914KUN7_MELIC
MDIDSFNSRIRRSPFFPRLCCSLLWRSLLSPITVLRLPPITVLLLPPVTVLLLTPITILLLAL